VETAIAALAAGRPPPASRALQRRFAREVGVPPRTLAAVFRFRRVFDALAENDAATWTQAAQAVGYFDHPQLVRDFRRFLGCTPSQYMRTRGALAAGVASIQDRAGGA
jgi:AraC-like DNA-binding protein